MSTNEIQPKVCKTCGTCPTCNSKPYWNPYPVPVYPYGQPYWYHPSISSDTTWVSPYTVTINKC